MTADARTIEQPLYTQEALPEALSTAAWFPPGASGFRALGFMGVYGVPRCVAAPA